jgi:hypothetical protein
MAGEPYEGDYLSQSVRMAARADLADQLEAAVYSLTSKTAKSLAAFIKALGNGVEGIEPEMAKANRQIAAEAQAAILEAYEAQSKHTPAYRTSPVQARNRRYAGGILRGILQDNFVSSDARGIYIGDTGRLDAGARQWRRLNYGAGGAAGGTAETFNLRWSNIELMLEEPGSARPPFRIPAGRWFGAAFYPSSELKVITPFGATSRGTRGRNPFADSRRQEARMTRGIRGQHWIAAGLRSVAENAPEAYSTILRKLWAQGDKAMKEQLAGDTGLVRPQAARSSIT